MLRALRQASVPLGAVPCDYPIWWQVLVHPLLPSPGLPPGVFQLSRGSNGSRFPRAGNDSPRLREWAGGCFSPRRGEGKPSMKVEQFKESFSLLGVMKRPSDIGPRLCSACGNRHRPFRHLSEPESCPLCDRTDRFLHPGVFFKRVSHHHILPKELLESPGLAAKLCRECRDGALQALTTTASLVAAHQPREDFERPPRTEVSGSPPKRAPVAVVVSARPTPEVATRMLRAPEVFQRIGLSRATIWRMQVRGDFPPSVKLGLNAVGWRERDVEEWLARRETSGRAAARFCSPDVTRTNSP